MTFFIVPMDNSFPWFKFKITLSGVIYVMSFRFNTRSNSWYLDILDSSNQVIIAGLAILIDRNLLGQYRTFAVPVGTLFATDDTGKELEPTLNSFRVDHTFWYADPIQ